MFRPILRRHLPLAALAGILLLPQVSAAQYRTFPGDFPLPGRGLPYSQDGFQPTSDHLPFPYDGIGGGFISQAVAQPVAPAAPVATSRALIRVRVPVGARVLFDGNPTTQTATDRLFTSPPLESGAVYTYQVSAQWTANGKAHDETRTVRVIPGQTVEVDFAR